MQSKKVELRQLLEEFLVDNGVENAEELADEFAEQLEDADYFRQDLGEDEDK